MSGFFTAPQFQPIEPPLFNGPEGDVLTIVSGTRQWAPGAPAPTPAIGTLIDASPGTGVFNDFDPAGFGPSVGRLDIDTSSGDVELTGLIAAADAQLLIVSNIGSGGHNLILDPLDASSAAGNQFRIPGQMFINDLDGFLLCYYAGTVNKWCMA